MPATFISMADKWFEIASVDHFWIRRRFEVLQKLSHELISAASDMAEIGCGHGLLQRQIEDAYGCEVTGFDVNEFALKKNLSRRSKVCNYDIFRRDPSLQQRFDVIFLFDVLEHIPDEDAFLQAVLFHLKPGGKLIVNVPAGQWAFSPYDIAAGHVRRYSMRALAATAARNNLQPQQWTYWGLPMIPLLLLRKLWLTGRHEQSSIITAGFDSRTPRINSALGALSRLEWTPQKLLGTSLMAIFSSPMR
jgi:SAM-dependent methyltransferase